MSQGGYSNSGHRYRTISDVWRHSPSAKPTSVVPGHDDDQWYEKSRQYWERSELTDDGVLGGFGHISEIDLQSSKKLICSLPGLNRNRALDCGSGIGRIVKGLLLPLFQHVDLVEQSPSHIEAARATLASHPSMKTFYQDGLQAFTPTPDFYDLIWIQWVVGYLTDADLEQFLDRCAAALFSPNAVVVLKENVARREFFLDADDNNVTRTLDQFQALFRRTQLILVKTRVQEGFPKDLHPVYTFVLRRRT